MESKQKRIAAFIESLPIDSNVGECESVLLSTNMNFMGGNGGRLYEFYCIQMHEIKKWW